MRSNDRYHAASPHHESFSICLPEGVLSFFPNRGLIPVDQRILPQAAASCPGKESLRLCQGWRGFPVMPVDDGELERFEDRKIDIMAMQMQQIAPQFLGRFEKSLI